VCVCDYLVWFAKEIESVRYKALYLEKEFGQAGATKYQSVRLADGTVRPLTTGERDGQESLPSGARLLTLDNLKSQGFRTGTTVNFEYQGRTFHPGAESHWKCTPEGLRRLAQIGRLAIEGKNLRYVRYLDDFAAVQVGNVWTDVGGIQSRVDPKVYSVQTSATVLTRVIAMTTNPSDLVLDPTCGSGTTAVTAERLGRRWVTFDTSRVAINVARKRLLSTVFEHYSTKNGSVASGLRFKTLPRVTLSSLAYDKEPEQIELVDQPLIEKDAVRVCGPFEVASLGRYSVEDWKGYVLREPGIGEAAKLENYIEVICRLYRKDAAIQGATGLVHAVAEAEKEKIAISVGPLSGRVTAKQINDAVQDALASGILEVHVLGWAFEANVGEVKSALEKRGKVTVELIMIRPDTLAEGLKATQPEMLFSPLALPDIEVRSEKNGKEKQLRVALKGVALFDRKRRTTEYKAADSGYISAWYLDEDYDGDCFVDCQMFFDFKKTPNIKAASSAMPSASRTSTTNSCQEASRDSSKGADRQFGFLPRPEMSKAA
jgi:adenine-specific DNA-methyltransferase